MPQTKNNWYLVLVVFMVTALLMLRNCNPCSLCAGKADTVVVDRPIILPPDTIEVVKYRAKIVYRDIYVHDTLVDTLIVTRPFTAIMDTSVGCNHVKLEYMFPENEFVNLRVTTCPDTVIVSDTVIRQTITATPTFWDDIKNIGIGFVGGFIVGSVVK